VAARRATVRDVAHRAGVSTATVSRSVNGTAHLSAETLGRVRTALAELDFRPSPTARDLRPRLPGALVPRGSTAAAPLRTPPTREG
jgi:DNA-binding LacI/PurR family transcriptional regulator